MHYQILEKYSQLKSKHNLSQEQEDKLISTYDEHVIRKFLDLYDKDVKQIHSNQEQIEKDLQCLYKESDKLANNSKEAVQVYDNFVEYLKESGDLYNWCNLIEKDVQEIYDKIASKHKADYESKHMQDKNETNLN